MERRVKHPSERPLRRTGERKLGFSRPVRQEPLTPGLRETQQSLHAIGFTARLTEEEGTS